MMNTRYNWLPEVFNDFFDIDVPTRRANTTTPAVNVTESDKGYTMKVAGPGLTKDDFRVSLNGDGNLTVKMDKQTDDKEQGSRYVRREWSFTKCEQTYSLPDDVDKDNIKAHVADGVLTIELPKIGKNEAQVSRSIQIG